MPRTFIFGSPSSRTPANPQRPEVRAPPRFCLWRAWEPHEDCPGSARFLYGIIPVIFISPWAVRISIGSMVVAQYMSMVCKPDRLALHHFDQATSFGKHRYAMLEENATNGKAAGGLDFYRSFFFQYSNHRRDREAAMDGIEKTDTSLIEMFLLT